MAEGLTVLQHSHSTPRPGMPGQPQPATRIPALAPRAKSAFSGQTPKAEAEWQRSKAYVAGKTAEWQTRDGSDPDFRDQKTEGERE